MKKQIISLLSAGILLCGLSVSALAAENADFAAASETEEAAAFAADDEVSANYPVVSDFENTATGIRVYWKAYSGAARYGLFYLGADGWHGIATTTSLNMEYENLKNGTAYTFTVRALNSSGDFISDYNRDGWSHTFMAPPVISELYSTDSGVSVSWNALKGEKKYRVYRMDDSHGWARIGDTAETTFIDKTAASGTRYSYTVRAITADGSRETTYFNPGKSIYYVAAPRVTEIVNRDGSADIYWNACRGASQYRVFWLDNGTWRGVGNTSSTRFSHSGLRNNVPTTYTVRCLDDDGDFISAYNAAGWTNTYLAPPVISSLKSTENGVEVKWNKLAGAVRYRVYRRDSSHGWARIGDTADAAWVDKTAASGNRYSYTVRAITADGSRETSYYNDGKSIYYVATPVVTEIVNRSGSAEIYWKACSGASKYRV
ncbi:MAG: fibronectin type III domain-containing protein, partial [Ruminococcus sp.]|nr:fibronectin type III domain-containing protein [Ruminococcus sp.]